MCGYEERKDGKWGRWGQRGMPTQTENKMSTKSGVSLSVCSLCFRLLIYHYFNISYEGMLMCWSRLSVCQCCVLLFAQAQCVGGWGIIYGGTTQLCHHSNIWTSAPTSHCKKRGSRNQMISHSSRLSLTCICTCMKTQ